MGYTEKEALALIANKPDGFKLDELAGLIESNVRAYMPVCFKVGGVDLEKVLRAAGFATLRSGACHVVVNVDGKFYCLSSNGYVAPYAARVYGS